MVYYWAEPFPPPGVTTVPVTGPTCHADSAQHGRRPDVTFHDDVTGLAWSTVPRPRGSQAGLTDTPLWRAPLRAPLRSESPWASVSALVMRRDPLPLALAEGCPFPSPSPPGHGRSCSRQPCPVPANWQCGRGGSEQHSLESPWPVPPGGPGSLPALPKDQDPRPENVGSSPPIPLGGDPLTWTSPASTGPLFKL